MPQVQIFASTILPNVTLLHEFDSLDDFKRGDLGIQFIKLSWGSVLYNHFETFHLQP
jgi:hypothetical protein